MMEKAIASSNARILIIDDEPTNTLLLERLLGRAGYSETSSLNDPALALAAIADLKPDLVLLDLLMPVIDGYYLLTAIRENANGHEATAREPRVPVIVLTADATHEARVRALDAGASDFLTKPFDAVEVLLRIRNQLETREAHVSLHNHGLELSDLVSQRTRQIELAHRALLGTLANAAEVRDDTTGRHVQRVGASALSLAQAMGLPTEEAAMIGDAAPLHDLGKIGIPDSVLLKPARLTKEEFAVIRTHPELGAEMLRGEDIPLLRTARSIALTHHERWDGGGYPRGLRGDEIPIAGRIVSVVDVFDALVHVRPYKPAWPVDRALDEISLNRGTQFDATVVDAFMATRGSDTSMPATAST